MFRKLLLIFSVIIVLLPFFSKTVFAHAVPIRYEPPASAAILKAPEYIRIKFTEHIEPRASSLVVFGPDGSRIDDGNATVFSANFHWLETKIYSNQQGTHTVSWQVISADDGHFTKGAYTFLIGAAIKADALPEIQKTIITTYNITFPEALAVFIEILGQALLIGTLIYKALIDKQPQKSWYVILIISSLLVIGGILLYFINRTTLLAQAQSESFFKAFTIFFRTLPGFLTFIRLIFGMTIIALAVFYKNILQKKLSAIDYVIGIIISLEILNRAVVSHAAASHFLPILSIIINFIHLFFKELWIGVVLVAAIIAFFQHQKKSFSKTEYIFRKLNRVTVVALAFGGLSGCYIVWLHLKSFSQIFTNQWGVTFFIILLASIVFLILRSYQIIKKTSSITLLAGEALLGIIILAITSLLIITTPPIHQLQLFNKTVRNEYVTTKIYKSPASPDNLFIKTKSEQPIHAITIIAENKSKNVGPIIAPYKHLAPDYFEFSQQIFSPPGNWKLTVVAQKKLGYDSNAIFEIEAPHDFEDRRADETSRLFGSFEIIIIVIGLIIVGSSYKLYKIS